MRQMYGASLDLCGLRTHSHLLVTLGPDGDRWDAVIVKLLDQAGAGPGVLNQDYGLLHLGPTSVDLDDLPLERREVQAHTDKVDQVIEVASDAPHGSNRIS